jgi:PAS domain S-box-containing protein
MPNELRTRRGQFDQAYRALVDRSLQGLMVYTEEGVVFANRAMTRITGYRTDELLGRQPDALLFPDGFDPAGGAESVSREEIPLRHKSGDRRRVEVVTDVIELEGRPAVMVALNDITERRAAEARLLESEARFRTVVENVPDYLALIDREGRFLYVNRVPETFAPEQVVGSRVVDHLPPAAREPFLHALTTALRHGRATHYEATVMRPDGTHVHYRNNVASIRQVGGGDAVLFISRDVTAELERRSEEQAIAGERRRIAREIHDGLAQDLAALAIRLGLCAEKADPALRGDLDALRDLVRGKLRDVRRLIFALRSVELEEMGFFQAVQKFVDAFADHNRLVVELSVKGDAEHLPFALEPVLFRIIQEALHNVARHGEADRASVRLVLAAEAVELSVKDNGVGFDAGIVQEKAGNGHLGLVQIRERVERLRGTLEVRSRPGHGTALRVRFPAD